MTNPSAGKPPEPLDRQPTLIGDLLQLRPLRSSDWDSLFAVASDPLIWEMHPDSERYQEEVFRQFFDDALASGGALVALERETGLMVGSSRYQSAGWGPNEVEIGWTFLARRRWGGRYNGEMKRLMLEHAFRSVERVLFVVGVGNLRSRRAVEKIGGVEVEHRRDATGRDAVVYELTPAAWAARPG